MKPLTQISKWIVFLMVIIFLGWAFFSSNYLFYQSTGMRLAREMVGGGPESGWSNLAQYPKVGLAIILIFILLFKVDDKRKKWVVPLSLVCCLTPLFMRGYENIMIIAFACLTIIIMIGWLYPSRREDQA
jgi:hypothetical protein